MSDGGLNWKGVLFWSILITIVAIVALYFLWKTPTGEAGPVRVAVDNVIAKVTSVQMLNLGSAGTLLSNNWATVAGIGVTAIPLTYTTIKSYLSQQKAKKELEAAQELAKINQSKDALHIEELEKKISLLESDSTADELQKKLSGIAGEKEQLETKITQLTGQVNQLSEQPKQIIQQLWQASGGKVQTIAGEQVKVIELTKTNVI